MTENTVIVFKPVRVMSAKELEILSNAVEAEGKKLGVKTMLVPFSADLLIDEDPGNEDPGKEEMTEEEIRAKAKDLKITSSHNKGLDKLKAEIAEREALDK